MTSDLFCRQFRSPEVKTITCYDLSGGDMIV